MHTSHSVTAQRPHGWWLLYQKAQILNMSIIAGKSMELGFSRRTHFYLALLFIMRLEPWPWKVTVRFLPVQKKSPVSLLHAGYAASLYLA